MYNLLGQVCTIEKDRLETCSNKEVGLEATKLVGKRTIVNIFCRCPWPAYWALAGHTENATLVHDKYACQYVSNFLDLLINIYL